MRITKLSKKWISLIACCLIVSLGGLTALSLWGFKNQWHRLPTLPPASTPPEQKLLGDIIAGNLSATRGHSDWAARYYLSATRLSGNNTIAHRAISMAYKADNPRLLLETSYANYLLDKTSPPNLYLYAYALLLNQRTEQSILMYAQLLSDDILHLADYTPLVPEKILSAPTFKTALVKASAKLKNNASAMAVMALMYNELKDTAKATQSNNSALQLAPDNKLAMQNQVTFYLQQNKPTAAIHFLQQRLQRSPKDSYAQFLLALLYYNAQRTTLAQTLFAQTLRVDWLKTQSALYLGEMAAANGDTQVAEDYLLTANTDPNLQPYAQLLLGDLAVLQKQYDTAITWYQKVRGDGYSFQAQLAIAKALYFQGNSAAAHDYLQTIQISDDKQFSLLVRFEAALYFKDQDWRGARDYLVKALKVSPDDPDILYALAVAYEEIGQFDAAKQVLVQTLEIAPLHIDSLNAMGDLLARQYQQYNTAESYLNKALALDPNNTPALHTLGLIYYKTAHYDEAISMLQKAYTLDNDPSIAADLGEVLWVHGQPQQAILIWKTALKESPQDPQLKETMHRFLVPR